jgi:hypothetical protein
MHLFDGLDFMLMPKFAGFYLSPPVYRLTPTNRLLSYRATGFGGDYGFFQFRIRIISVSLKKNFAAASESSILPFSGKEAMRYYTVKAN